VLKRGDESSNSIKKLDIVFAVGLSLNFVVLHIGSEEAFGHYVGQYFGQNVF